MKGPPLDVDKELAEGFKIRLQLLDEAHSRARTPKQRRRIERQIADVHREMNKLIQLRKNVDRAFENWVRTLNPPKGTA